MSGNQAIARSVLRAAVIRRDDLELHVYRDIADIAPMEWDSILPPSDIQRTHRFIRCCQESGVEQADYWHVMIYDRRALVAIASLSRIVVALDVLAGPGVGRAVSVARRFHAGFLRVPMLLCGLPVSFGQPCLAFRTGTHAARAVTAIAHLMEKIAVETSTPVLCWKEFDDALAEHLTPLGEAGYFRAASLPSWSLAIRWKSFDEYARSMRSGYRRQLVSTLAAGRRARLRIRRADDFARDTPAIFSLYEQVIDRARYRLERLNRPFFDALHRRLGRESSALMLEQDGRSASAAVVLRSGRDATFLLTGIDYDAQNAGPVYENLVTEVIREAIAGGATRLEMGQTSAPLKSRLGAVPANRWIFLRHRSRAWHYVLRALSPVLFPAGTTPGRRVFRDSAAD